MVDVSNNWSVLSDFDNILYLIIFHLDTTCICIFIMLSIVLIIYHTFLFLVYAITDSKEIRNILFLKTYSNKY